MTIRWITDQLGTSPWNEGLFNNHLIVVDVRLLRDTCGNSPILVMEKITTAIENLSDGKRVVICCDHGISRSNAIAACVLSKIKSIGLEEALQQVISATGETGIKIDLVHDLRQVLDVSLASATDPNMLVLGLDGLVGRAVFEVLSPSQLNCDIESNHELLWNPVLLDSAMQLGACNHILFCWHPRGLDTNAAAGQLITALRNVLEVCRVREASIVFLSGQQVFSGCREAGLSSFGEGDELSPASAAGHGLFLAEMLVRQYAKSYGLCTLIVRTPYVYGPRDERPWLLNTLIHKALNSEDIITHRYRNGSPTIGLIHVDDLVSALLLAVRQRLKGVLHVSSKDMITTSDLAEMIVRASGSRSTLRSIDMPDNFRSVCLESRIGTAVPAWMPKVELEHGLKDLIDDFIPHC
jgi:nucleoside-diphosphate-sugar epimerase